MSDNARAIVELLQVYGLRVLAAIAILIIGRILAGLVRAGVHKALARAKVDVSVARFLGNLGFALVLTFAVVAALSKFGVETASIVGVLAAAGFAVGLALQGSLANFSAGVMILLFRPFHVGDYVQIAGVGGTVKEVQLFNTILATPDNVMVVVPNGKAYGDIISNYSAYDTRRIDLAIGISYDADIGKAMAAAHDVVKGEARILPDPEPMVVVSELADSSVNLIVRVWTQGADYWNVKFDMQRALKEAFDASGIEIPFPQRVVHLIDQKG
ncbi:MAG: mechanosensitive ion channel [Gemmatimonadota bacterium]|jgi:small conductance mechanosensitive channel